MIRFAWPAVLPVLATLAGLFATPAIAARSDAPRRLDPARIIVTIEADGGPRNIRCLSPVAISVCPVLTKAVSGWKFEAGKRSGVAVAIDVVLDLQLEAVKNGAGFALRVLEADLLLRGPTDVAEPNMPPPQYPRDSLMRGKTGVVEVELFTDPGSTRYRVGRTWLNGRPPTRPDLLVSAAVQAAERWPVEPRAPEVIAECAKVIFVLKPGPEPKFKDRACKDTYVEGFVAPKLVTEVAKATL